MGGVDIANQLRSTYELHQPARRTWWPIFYWLLDASLVNAYQLSTVYAEQKALKPFTHCQFRTYIATSLLERSIAVKIRKLNSTL